MRVRALDANGDWTFGRGTNDYLVDLKAIEQNISTRLKSFLGDCFFDINAGIDWFGFLGGKDQLGLNLAVRAVILNTDGVTALTQFSVELNHTTRLFTMTYGVTTVFSSAFRSSVQVEV